MLCRRSTIPKKRKLDIETDIEYSAASFSNFRASEKKNPLSRKLIAGRVGRGRIENRLCNFADIYPEGCLEVRPRTPPRSKQDFDQTSIDLKRLRLLLIRTIKGTMVR